MYNLCYIYYLYLMKCFYTPFNFICCINCRCTKIIINSDNDMDDRKD